MKKLLYTLAFAVCATALALPASALAAPALDSIPDEVRSAYSFNGPIYATASDGETLYIGGDFTSITLNPEGEPLEVARNYIAAIDLATNEITDFDPNLDSSASALVLSDDGSTLFAGGWFTCVGGVDGEFNCLGDTRNSIAAFDTATGALTAFDPQTDGAVYSLAYYDYGVGGSIEGEVLYVAGGFDDVNGGTARNNAAAFNVADSLATDFDPNVNDWVYAISVSPDGNTVYLGGGFSEVNVIGVPQGGFGAFDALTGLLMDPYPSFPGSSVNALAQTSDGATMYVGGSLSQYFLASGEGALFEEDTDTFIKTPRVFTSGGGGGDDPGFTINAVIPDGAGGWYVGGSFGYVDGVEQSRLAHINADGTHDTDFGPDIDNGEVYALALSPDLATLYVGGTFTSVDDGTTRNYIAAFNTADSSVTTFDPSADGTVYALALSSDGGTLYVGGIFGTFTAGNRYGVAAFNTATGALLDFDADLYGDGYAYALALSGDDSILYVGGNFDAVKYGAGPGTPRNHIAAFTTAGAGAVVAGFDPNADGFVEDLVLSGDESTIYAGGYFTTIGGVVRQGFAEIDVSDGSVTDLLDAGISSSFEINPQIFAVALSSDGQTIYVGGADFDEVGGETRQYFAEIDATTGLATSFYPEFDGAVRDIAVSDFGGDNLVYIGGSFTGMNTTDISNLVAIDLTDGSLDESFDPVFDDSVNSLALTSDDEILYVGGYFTDIDGTSRSGLAALSASAGTLTVFNPVVPEGYETTYNISLSSDDTELYTGAAAYDDILEAEVGRLLVFTGDIGGGGDDDDEEPPVIDDGDDDDDEGGGGGGSSSRRGASTDDPLKRILTQLITVLTELITLISAQQQN